MTVVTDDSILAAAAAEPGGDMTLMQVYRENIYKTKNITADDFSKLSVAARMRLLKQAMGGQSRPSRSIFSTTTCSRRNSAQPSSTRTTTPSSQHSRTAPSRSG